MRKYFLLYQMAVHKRKWQCRGGEGSKITQNFQTNRIKKTAVKNPEKIADIFFGYFQMTA